MKKTLIKGLAIVLVLSFLSPSLNLHVHAASSKKITIKKYIELLVTKSKLKNPENMEELEIEETPTKYILTARALDIVKEGQFKDYNKNITRADAAVLTNRVDELLNGADSYNQKLYDQIKTKKRISDMSKIDKSKRSAVYKVFAKGIMIGESNGAYTQNRKFLGNNELLNDEANTIVSRLMTNSKRKQLSFDGQVIRTTKLPKSYKNYEYILESFPNSFYEMKFDYNFLTYGREPVELVDYASPAKFKQKIFKNSFKEYKMQEILDLYLDSWVKTVETNLYQRFNVDYRTIEKNNKWINALRKTYYVYDDPAMDNRTTKPIKNYIKKMKQNKVIIKSSQITVEPSTIYYSKGYYLRAYVKFKVVSATSFNVKHNEIIFTEDFAWIKDLKKGQWIEGYYDICIGTANGGSIGEDYAVFNDSINDYYYKGR